MNTFLPDKVMLDLMLRAFAERVTSVGIKDWNTAVLEQVGVSFDAGRERQQEPEQFYMSCAVPFAAVIADKIGKHPIICDRLTNWHDSVVAESGNYAMRLFVDTDVMTGKQNGRFDVLYRMAPDAR